MQHVGGIGWVPGKRYVDADEKEFYVVQSCCQSLHMSFKRLLVCSTYFLQARPIPTRVWVGKATPVQPTDQC